MSKPKKPAKIGFIDKIRKSLFHPSELYAAVRKEPIEEAIKYYIILLLLFFISAAICYLLIPLFFPQDLPQQNLPGLSDTSLVFAQDPITTTTLGDLATSFLYCVLGLFLCSAVLHFFVRMFGGKKGFVQTLKAFCYSSTPMMVVGSILIFFSTIFMTFSRGISDVAISFLYEMVISLITGVLVIAIYMWQIYLSILGVSKLHEIPKSKALFATIIPLVIVAVIILILLLFAFSMAFVS